MERRNPSSCCDCCAWAVCLACCSACFWPFFCCRRPLTAPTVAPMAAPSPASPAMAPIAAPPAAPLPLRRPLSEHCPRLPGRVEQERLDPIRFVVWRRCSTRLHLSPVALDPAVSWDRHRGQRL